jgi:hypothetical protein
MNFSRSDRMTARWMAGVLAVVAMAISLGGCATKEGHRMIEYKSGGNRLQEKKAGDTGRYVLHTGTGRTVAFRVEKGQQVGFRRRDNTVEAVAGDNPAVELEGADARGAYWEFEKKTGK